MSCHGDAGGESAGFERTGGIEAFVFDVDVGKLATREHGREAFPERYGIGFGKDRVIAPHRRSASGESRGREAALDVGKIVASIENAGVFGTNGLRTVGGIVFPASSAFEVCKHAEVSLTSASGSRRPAAGL
jgi:hypothetical protein